MIRALVIGFYTTLKHLFRTPITVNYPDQKVPMFPRYRGKQVLMRDENGLEKCVACGLCAVACPADAIYLEPAENDGSVQAGPRYAKVYQIHKTRCIFCGYCEEACPVSVIFIRKHVNVLSRVAAEIGASLVPHFEPVGALIDRVKGSKENFDRLTLAVLPA